jgi:YD repeat-containing protein
VGLNITATPGNHSLKMEYDIEGVDGGNYDSTLIVPPIIPPPPPPPIINGVSPLSGAAGAAITVTGVNFGTTAGSVTFNGVSGTGTTWSATSILTHVPSGTSTGPIRVTTSVGTSNAVTFTIASVGTLSGTATRATGGTPVASAFVEVLQSGITKASQTTGANGAYTFASLSSGFYDLRVTASALLTGVRTHISVGGGTTIADVALVEGGSIIGTVSDASSSTPLAGASLWALQDGSPVQTGLSGANGTFALQAIPPGTYTLETHDVGYNTHSTPGVVVTSGQATPANVSLDPFAILPIRYSYDDADRLIAVVNTAGEIARYSYDSVGNRLTISRESGANLVVTALSPPRGPIGTTVTIGGSGFSTNPAQDSVTFGGVPAAISAATETSLTVTVPSGVSAGSVSVSVTSPAGTGAAPNGFVVGATDAPVVSGFTPTIGLPGTSVSVTGSNFSLTLSENTASFNVAQAQVVSATATTLGTVVPSTARSGYISVFTSKGAGKSATPFFVPPSPYVATDVGSTQLLPFGVPITVNIPTAGKIALLAFNGIAGHRLAVTQSWGNPSCTSTLTLYDTRLEPSPSGQVDLFVPVDFSGYVDGRILPYTGTYTLVWKLCPTGSGNSTVTLYDVPADVTASILTNAQPVTVTTVLGQNGRVTFDGTAGQRVTLFQASSNVRTYVLEPGQWGTAQQIVSGWFGPVTLQATGVHTLFVDPQGASTGDTTLTLYNVPPDPIAPITVGGSPVTVSIEAPGNHARLTFTVASSQTINIQHQQTTINSLLLSVYNQSNPSNPLVNTFSSGSVTTTLPAAGTYVIDLSPWAFGQTGDITVQLNNVPAPNLESTTINSHPGFMATSPTPPTQTLPVNDADTAVDLRGTSTAGGALPVGGLITANPVTRLWR